MQGLMFVRIRPIRLNIRNVPKIYFKLLLFKHFVLFNKIYKVFKKFNIFLYLKNILSFLTWVKVCIIGYKLKDNKLASANSEYKRK